MWLQVCILETSEKKKLDETFNSHKQDTIDFFFKTKWPQKQMHKCSHIFFF